MSVTMISVQNNCPSMADKRFYRDTADVELLTYVPKFI